MTILEQINANPLLRELPGDNLKNPALYTYGYCYDPDSPSLMKVDEVAAPHVRYIYQKFLSGWPLSDIANALNDMEAPTPVMRKEQFGFNREHSAGYWQSCTVSQLMVNHAYVGDHIFSLPMPQPVLATPAVRTMSHGPAIFIPAWCPLPEQRH